MFRNGDALRCKAMARLRAPELRQSTAPYGVVKAECSTVQLGQRLSSARPCEGNADRRTAKLGESKAKLGEGKAKLGEGKA